MPARISGHWTREKLHFLECYAPAFVRACKSAEGGCFIDAFSGPGWNEDEQGRFKGSPLIVTRYNFRDIFLIDSDPANTEALNHLDFDSRVEIMTGDANELVLVALCSVPDWLPALIFLDQNSNQVSFATLREIAGWSRQRNRKPELLVLLPTGMVLQRLFPRGRPAQHTHVLDKVFGSEEVWRPIEEQRMAGGLRRGSIIQALTESYMTLLTGTLGYVEQPLHRHIRMGGERGVFLYTLVFATDHSVGRRTMDKCFRHRHSGQGALF
ncbi:MAG: three-Cys-motif partner protein TcmP [candidate division NC10 bacterium]|nr:three-Cys-motif partner protein TcmP [Thermoleophilia bacterium]NJD68808.1 three-Cys-motif partner protein TcmP [candidate division NC10 bacterium]